MSAAHANASGYLQTHPVDMVVDAPERHGEAVEIPKDGLEGVEPVAPQDHLVSAKWNGEEVDVEEFITDTDWDGGSDAMAGDSVTIGDAHYHA